MAAALQMLDMDMLPEQLHPAASIIDPGLLPGLPRHGIGRACKVGKEQIVGLLAALRLFVAADAAARRDGWLARARRIEAGLQAMDGIEARMRDRGEVPELAVRAPDGRARDLVLALERQEPSIRLDWDEIGEGRLLLSPVCLRDGDERLIVEGFRRALAALSGGGV
jgi:L-seryl-tRNA(Ser) seleniumtransferase